MSDRNRNRLPGTIELPLAEEGALLESGKVTENAKQWVLQAFDLDFFKPDEKTWAGIGMSSVIAGTPPSPPPRAKVIASKWFPELMPYDDEEPLDQPKIVPLNSVVSTIEPEKPWISPDPFEQKTPISVLEQDHKSYIERFRQFFEGLESDTLERSIERYAKILLYLLLEFGIDMSTENSSVNEELQEAKKDQIMTDLFFECRKDPEMVTKYSAEMLRKEQLWEKYKKYYVELNALEKDEMKLRYIFYIGRYEILRWIREETEKNRRIERELEKMRREREEKRIEAEKQKIRAEEEKQQRMEQEILERKQKEEEIRQREEKKRQREEKKRQKEEAERMWSEQLQAKIKVIEEEAKYALDKQQAQMNLRERIGGIAKKEVQWMVETMREPLFQEATQNTVFDPVQIRSIWTTVVVFWIEGETQNLVQKIIEEALPQNPEKPEIIEITRKLTEECNFPEIIRGIFEAAISGRLQHEQKHAKRLECGEKDVTVLGYN